MPRSNAFCTSSYTPKEGDTFLPEVRPFAQVWRKGYWVEVSLGWREVNVGDIVQFKQVRHTSFDSLCYVVARKTTSDQFGVVAHVSYFKVVCSKTFGEWDYQRETRLGNMLADVALHGKQMEDSFQRAVLATVCPGPHVSVETDLHVYSTEECLFFTVIVDGVRRVFKTGEVDVWLTGTEEEQRATMYRFEPQPHFFSM
jgi:hypothetical protein